jgi:hypothetical protein
MTTLYNLANQYVNMENLANDLLDKEEDVTEEDIQMFIDTLEAIQDSMEIKFSNTVRFIKNLEGSVNAYKAEENRLNKRRKTMENTIKSLKTYMQSMMEVTGKDKVKADLFNLRLQNNPPSAQILDEEKIPDQYREKQPDKILIKEIIKDLQLLKEIEGAALAPEKKHLRIT